MNSSTTGLYQQSGVLEAWLASKIEPSEIMSDILNDVRFPVMDLTWNRLHSHEMEVGMDQTASACGQRAKGLM